MENQRVAKTSALGGAAVEAVLRAAAMFLAAVTVALLLAGAMALYSATQATAPATELQDIWLIPVAQGVSAI